MSICVSVRTEQFIFTIRISVKCYIVILGILYAKHVEQIQFCLKCEQRHIFDMKAHLYLQYLAVCDIKTRKGYLVIFEVGTADNEERVQDLNVVFCNIFHNKSEGKT
jgi:hypothetical protein